VNAYHEPPKEQHESEQEGDQSDPLFSDAPPIIYATVDDALIDAVWEWLVKHADVNIRAVNNAEADAADAGVAQVQLSHGDGFPGAASTLTSKHASERVFASQDRMWHAITGHGVDHKRVSEKEFECLSVIASYGSAGVVQPTITRMTGQDKRSVPHRTDVLTQKGYITKKTVIAGGATTSLLTLKRYDDKGQNRSKAPTLWHGPGIVDLDAMFNQTMDLLKRQPQRLMVVQDLRIELGIHHKEKKKQTRELMRCIRRLVESGCIRKCTATSQTETGEITSEKGVRCIQLMREPTALDKINWRKKESAKQRRAAAQQSVSKTAAVPAEENIDIDSEDEDDDALADMEEAMEVRNVPQWTPDLPYVNFLFDMIDRAGTNGISSTALSQCATGPLWRRPLDEIMARLTDKWQCSQPPHLRHLGIVRVTAARDKFYHYIYRTYEHFREAVREGQATWDDANERLKQVTKGKKQGSTATGEQPVKADLDDWGFPRYSAKLFAGRNGRASLAECTVVSGLPRLSKSAADRGITVSPQTEMVESTIRSEVPRPAKSTAKRRTTTTPRMEGTDVIASQGSQSNADDTPNSRPKIRITALKNDKAFEDWVQVTAERLVRPEMRGWRRETGQPAAEYPRISTSDDADSDERTNRRRNSIEPDQGADDAFAQAQDVELAAVQSDAAASLPQDPIQEMKERLLQRSRPGIYINPPGALQLKAESFVRSGRPRNALIAVVKTSRLKELEWFQEELARVAPIASVKRTKNVGKFSDSNGVPMSTMKRPRGRPRKVQLAGASIEELTVSLDNLGEAFETASQDTPTGIVSKRPRGESSRVQPTEVPNEELAELRDDYGEAVESDEEDATLFGRNSGMSKFRATPAQAAGPVFGSSLPAWHAQLPIDATPEAGQGTRRSSTQHIAREVITPSGEDHSASPAHPLASPGSEKVYANRSPVIGIAIPTGTDIADRQATIAETITPAAGSVQYYNKSYVDAHPTEDFHHCGHGRFKRGKRVSTKRKRSGNEAEARELPTVGKPLATPGNAVGIEPAHSSIDDSLPGATQVSAINDPTVPANDTALQDVRDESVAETHVGSNVRQKNSSTRGQHRKDGFESDRQRTPSGKESLSNGQSPRLGDLSRWSATPDEAVLTDTRSGAQSGTQVQLFPHSGPAEDRLSTKLSMVDHAKTAEPVRDQSESVPSEAPLAVAVNETFGRTYVQARPREKFYHVGRGRWRRGEKPAMRKGDRKITQENRPASDRLYSSPAPSPISSPAVAGASRSASKAPATKPVSMESLESTTVWDLGAAQLVSRSDVDASWQRPFQEDAADSTAIVRPIDETATSKEHGQDTRAEQHEPKVAEGETLSPTVPALPLVQSTVESMNGVIGRSSEPAQPESRKGHNVPAAASLVGGEHSAAANITWNPEETSAMDLDENPRLENAPAPAHPGEADQDQDPLDGAAIATTSHFQSTDIDMANAHNAIQVDGPVLKGGAAAGRTGVPYRKGGQKIVVDVVKQCGGVYPGNREIWYPFATAWTEMHHAMPDRQVLDRALKNALDSGNLKKMIFAFQDKKGLNVEGKLLMLPEVSQFSASVQEVKKAIIAAHPLQYVPKEAEVSEEIRKRAKMVARPDMGRNVSEIQAASERASAKSGAKGTYSNEFPVVEGLLVRRTTAATKLARGEHRVLGFGRTLKERRQLDRQTASGASALGGKRRLDLGTGPMSMGRLRSLNNTNAAMRNPLRSLRIVRKPVALGYLPSQLAHSLCNPNYFAPQEDPMPVQRRKGGLKRGFAKAAALRLFEDNSKMLMSPFQTLHVPSGTFGTYCNTLARLRPRGTRTGPMALDEELDAPETLSEILARSDLLGHAAAGPRETAEYQFRREVDRVYEWEKDLIETKSRLGDCQGWTFINHALNQRLVVPETNFTKQTPTTTRYGYNPQHAPAEPSELSLPALLSQNAANMAISQPPATDPLRSTTRYQHRAGGGASTSYALPAFARLQAQPPISVESYFDRAYVEQHAEETFHHVGGGRYRRGPKPTRLRQLSNTATLDPQLMSQQVPPLPHLLGFPAQSSSLSPTPALAPLPPPQSTPTTSRQRYKSRKRKAADADVDDGTTLGSDGDFGSKMYKVRILGRDRATAAAFTDGEMLVRAIALVGMLCGGVKMSGFSWEIVAHAMNFRYEGEFLRRWWQKNRKTRDADVKRIRDTLREPFLRDCEKEELPMIDYSDLESIEWSLLMKWAGKQIQPAGYGQDMALRSLPTTRKALEAGYNVIEPKQLYELDKNDFFTSTTDTHQKDLAHRYLRGSALPGDERPSKIRKEDLTLLKSWCRAVTVTKGENYNDKEAARIIGHFAPPLVRKAINELVEAQILASAKKGRHLPGRNYNLSAVMLRTFARWPEPEATYLHDVATAWQSIVARLQSSDKLELSMHTKDPEAVVLTNLANQARVKPVSILPERNDDPNAPFPKLSAFGYTDYSYNAKYVDKSRLRFPIVYEKTSLWSSEHGLKRIPIPMQPAPVEGEPWLRIPFWVDIHGNFIDDMWEMVLRSVLHLLVFRPGITVTHIEQLHKGKIGLWEIEMIVDWMEKTGLAKRVGARKRVDGRWKGGWRADDWWFCAMAPDIASWQTVSSASNDEDVDMEPSTPSL